MSSSLWLKQGIYDPTKRFSFKNITAEPFTFTWNSQPIIVKPGETIELPHHLAVLATTKLVDQIMLAEIKVEEDKVKAETKNPYYHSPRAGSMAVPAAREVWEKQICTELETTKSKMSESQLGIIRNELKETLTKDMSAKPSASMSSISLSPKEFEDINIAAK